MTTRYRCPTCVLETNRSERGEWICPSCFSEPDRVVVYMEEVPSTPVQHTGGQE